MARIAGLPYLRRRRRSCAMRRVASAALGLPPLPAPRTAALKSQAKRPPVMPRWAAACILALIAALAGCTGGGAGPQSDVDGATSTTGILRGVVVDEAVRPVAGASVNVTAPGVRYNATTGDDGLFRFTGLAPGTYVVEAGKRFYSPHQTAVVVVADVDEPEAARLQLVFEPRAMPFAQVYKYEGLLECGSNVAHVCSNVNIATWIVVCANTGVCVGNVTSDRSLFFQAVDPNPTFLQAELAWDSTQPVGAEMSFYIGGGNEAELKAGMGATYNITDGPSPLMLRISDHEGESAWCRTQDPPCGERVLSESGIGSERALLVQVEGGPTMKTPLCGTVSPCAAGVSAKQAFTMYTTVFYGYEPPLDWLFTASGAPPAPPV